MQTESVVAKQPSKYWKQREEDEHHGDVVLVPGSILTLQVDGRIVFQEIGLEGRLTHIHYGVAVEPEYIPEGVDVQQALEEYLAAWRKWDRVASRWEEKLFVKPN